MANEVKFTLAMDGGAAVVTDLDQVGRKLIDVNTKIKDAGSGADAFGGSMRTVGSQLRGFGGDVNDAKGSVDSLAHGLKSAFIGSSVAVGLIGLKNTMMDFTQSMVQAQIQVDQLRNGLNFAVGRNKAASELNFIRESSRALGLEFVSTSQQYMKLAASARGTSLEGQKVHDVFTAVAQASTVMGLSAEQTSGALLSISQMISKNTIMSEELKGQLGERLPGAFQIAARSMGVTTEQLNKMLETGQVVAGDFLPRFAQQLSQEVAPEVNAASMSMQASVNRLANSWTSLKQAMVEGGMGKSIASGMTSLSRSVDGVAESMKDAKAQGAGFITQFADMAGGALAIMIPFVDAPRSFNGHLRDAEQELEVLQKKLAAVPDNIYLKSETYQAQLYVKELRAIKKAKDDLNPDYASPAEDRRFALSADAYREKEKVKKTYDDLLQNLSGVGSKFQEHLSQLKAGFDAGHVGHAKYVADVKTLIEKEGGIRKEAAKTRSEADKGLATYNDLVAKSAGLNANFTEEWNKLTAAQKGGKISIDQLTIAQAQLLKEQTFAKDATKALTDAEREQEKVTTLLFAVGQKEIDQIDAKIKKQIETNEQIGLTAAQVLGLNSVRQEQSALADEEYAQALRNAAVYAGEYKDAYLQYANALELAAKKRRELSVLDAAGGEKKAAAEAMKEWQKAADKINDSITDALMRGFESGKGFAESLRDTVINMFKTMVLRPTVSAIVNPVTQGITGAFQSAGASMVGSATGSFGAGSLFSAAGMTALGESFGASAMATMTGSSFANASIVGQFAGGGAAGTGIASTLGAAMPYIAAAVLAYELLNGSDAVSSSDSGRARIDYTSSGVGGPVYSTTGSAEQIEKMALATNGLAKSYFDTAKALGIAAIKGAFEVGTNTGREGENPMTVLGANVGSKSFSSGEFSSADTAAYSLAASRAVFAALQGSDLPSYLSKAFNGLAAEAMSQEQITGTLAYAASLKQVRDALLETREPMAVLQSNVDQAFATLSTTSDTFKNDFVAALDGGISPEKLAQWQSLQTAMTDLAALAEKDAQAKEVEAKAKREILKKEEDLFTSWTQKLAVLQGTTTERKLALEADLANATGIVTKAVINRVYALEDEKTALEAMADAAVIASDKIKAAAEVYKQAAAERLSAVTSTASDAYAGLERAVAAQRAQEQAATEAQKVIATAAFTSQNELYQTQLDKTKASLDAVGNSVGKLKSLSGSLKSTLDAMRITGSDSAYRAAAQAQIKAAVATARSGGGLPMDGQLQSALATVSKPSEQLFSTFQDYARDFYKTANDISALSELTDAQLNTDEITQALLKEQVDLIGDQQRTLKDGFRAQVSTLDSILANAKKQLDAANGLDTRVLSVTDALAELNTAIDKLSGTRASQGLATTAGVADGRATAIKDYITSAMGSGLSGSALANTIAAKAKEVGTTEGEIARAIGWDIAKVREFFAGAGIPQFAVGTDYLPRDTLAMLHEGEQVVPKAYNPNAPGNSNADTAAALRALADRLDRIEANTRATAGHTAGTDRKLARVIPGNALITEVAA